jgi:hypothetical protein
MFLSTNYRYSLNKLENTTRLFNLLNNEKECKKTFKVKDDCWFEFDYFADNSLILHEVTIRVISEKRFLFQRFKDYERAFVFLKKNKWVGDVSMEIKSDNIDELEECKISFRN